MTSEAPVLLTGATGFLGSHLRVALEGAGRPLRLGSRNPDRARREDPDGDWVRLDVEEPSSLKAALEGCDSAFFLVHSVGKSADYPERERRAAQAFAEEAARQGLRRIVYMGGVAPPKDPSRHLQSRIETGEILRRGSVSTVELRAAMIVGHGSLSWRMVRDLARRLPAMLLPLWLGNHSWPVAVDDVVAALLTALDLPDAEARCYDLPGAERISHRDTLLRTAGAMGLLPVMLGVPVVTPTLSSYWIGLVTSVDLPLARELVQGLLYDLDPSQPSFWERMEGREPTPLDEAIRRALADESGGGMPSPSARERMRAIGAEFSGHRPSPRKPGPLRER